MHPSINVRERSDIEQAERYQIYAAHLFRCGQKMMNKDMPNLATSYFDAANSYYRSARNLMGVD